MLTLVLAGCSGGDEAGRGGEGEPGTRPAATKGEHAARRRPASDAPAGPEAEGEGYSLKLSAEESVVGEDSTLTLALQTEPPWHLNAEYPLSVSLGGAPEVILKRETLSVEDAEAKSDEALMFRIPFSAATAGRHRVDAIVDFAVCTATSCVPEERTLSLHVAVAAVDPPSAAQRDEQ